MIDKPPEPQHPDKIVKVQCYRCGRLAWAGPDVELLCGHCYKEKSKHLIFGDLEWDRRKDDFVISFEGMVLTEDQKDWITLQIVELEEATYELAYYARAHE